MAAVCLYIELCLIQPILCRTQGTLNAPECYITLFSIWQPFFPENLRKMIEFENFSFLTK